MSYDRCKALLANSTKAKATSHSYTHTATLQVEGSKRNTLERHHLNMASTSKQVDEVVNIQTGRQKYAELRSDGEEGNHLFVCLLFLLCISLPI